MNRETNEKEIEKKDEDHPADTSGETFIFRPTNDGSAADD